MHLSRPTATLIGFAAILLWATLALFTAMSGSVPPLQLNAMSFAVGGVAGAILLLFRPGAARALRQPLPVWLLGVGGLFGYHALYFTALRNAPPVEAGLINYLWPILIVFFSALLPGEKLGVHHIAGGLVALVGAVLVVTGGQGLALDPEHAFGYAAAGLAALAWSTYSVLSRRFANVPSDAITGFCLATAVLSAACHLAFEQTVWPASVLEWLAIVALGLGPVGLAFYVWDIGVKHGDIQVLGTAAYAAPLLSTLLLIAFGYGRFTLAIALACILITLGALIAAKDMLRRRRRDPVSALMHEWDSPEDEAAYRDL
jgi:drug/metabolite transporter (DMT)-like permease